MVGFGETAKTNFQHIPLKNLAKNSELKMLERNSKGRFPMQNGTCKDINKYYLNLFKKLNSCPTHENLNWS